MSIFDKRYKNDTTGRKSIDPRNYTALYITLKKLQTMEKFFSSVRKVDIIVQNYIEWKYKLNTF